MTRDREDVALGRHMPEVARRLEPYIGDVCPRDDPPQHSHHHVSLVLDDLADRAATLVAVMPPRQHRATIERLICPHEPDRGRRAVDALIEGAVVAEDERGCLRLLSPGL